MKKPIPVTTQSMTAASGSMKKPACALKNWSPASPLGLPAVIQSKMTFVHARSVFPACSAPCSAPCASPFQSPSIPSNSENEIIALQPTPIQIGQCDFSFNHRAPKNPDIAAPSSGSSGISQAYLTAKRCSISALELPPRVGVQRLFLPEQQYDQPQRQRRLGRRDHQDEDHERLPVQVAVIAPKRDQVDRHALEHQLGAEKHDDQVPARHEPDQPDHKHDRADGQVMLEGQLGHVSGYSFCLGF